MSAFVEEARRTTFPAMGNTAHVVVIGGTEEHLDMAHKRIDELESKWSRFIPLSDVARLNSAQGKTVVVAPETISLLHYMVDAHRITSGLFDPTRLPQLLEAGYSQSMKSERLTILPTGTTWSHGLDDLSIDVDRRCVTLPPDVTIDAGGIGKGLAADIVANEIISAGAHGTLVNIGGDLRCIGMGDRDGVWEVAIAGPDGTGEIERIRLQSGAVATSSVYAKTFMQGDETRSHVIDPRSNRAVAPAGATVVQATVIAHECVWSEVLTKALILENPHRGIALVDDLDLAAMIINGDGSAYQSAIWRSTNWARFQA